MTNKPETNCPTDPCFSPIIQGYWRLLDWEFSAQETLSFLKGHVELGVTTIDHADLYGDYGAEAVFGQALRLDPSLRDQLQIVTKCNIQLLTRKAPLRQHKHYDSSAAHIEWSVEQSLSKLGTDHIDVLLLHRPDPLLDADEVAEAFERLRSSGKVQHFGVSNYSSGQMELLQSRLPFSLVTNQVEINPLNSQVLVDGTLDYLQRQRLRPMAWSCLAGGRLFQGEDEPSEQCRKKLQAVGEELGGATIDQVALAWVLRLPCAPLPIIGSGRLKRVASAVAALDLALTRDQWFGIWQAGRGIEVP